MIDFLLKLGHQYLEAMANKVVYFTTLTVAVGGGAATSVAVSQVKEMSFITLLVVEYGGFVAMLAGISVCLKNLADMVINVRKAWRERNPP